MAKFRAARRLYARMLRDEFGASEASCRLRFHTQTGGVTLTAQQPLNNVVRVTVQALAATLGGTQSLHTNAYDEALSLPTAEAATLALRTQQIVAFESGVANTVDPLAGSYYVEHLTSQLETQARELAAHVQAMGGAVAAIEAGFVQEEIARSAYQYQLSVERGETRVVGVNAFGDDVPPPTIPAPDYSTLEREQVERLRAIRARRDPVAIDRSLAALAHSADGLRDASAPHAAVLPVIVEAVRARATVGEISDTLARAWGVYRPLR